MSPKELVLAPVLAALVLAGCAGRRETLLARLRTDDPCVQTAAIAEVITHKDRSMAGELIALAQSDDDGVRFMAASGLHALTGKETNFHHANSAERQRIIQEWRAWWEKEGPAPGAAGATSAAMPGASASGGAAGGK